jgi:hypothetical protein
MSLPISDIDQRGAGLMDSARESTIVNASAKTESD